jgi:hypothetical protein
MSSAQKRRLGELPRCVMRYVTTRRAMKATSPNRELLCPLSELPILLFLFSHAGLKRKKDAFTNPPHLLRQLFCKFYPISNTWSSSQAHKLNNRRLNTMTFFPAARGAAIRQAFASGSRATSKTPSASFSRCLVCEQHQQQRASQQRVQRLFSTSTSARDVSQAPAETSTAAALGFTDAERAKPAGSWTSPASSSSGDAAASTGHEDTQGSTLPGASPFEGIEAETESPRYIIERAGPTGASLPVYLDYRNNRSRVFTVLRKIGGDIHVRNEKESKFLCLR